MCWRERDCHRCREAWEAHLEEGWVAWVMRVCHHLRLVAWANLEHREVLEERVHHLRHRLRPGVWVGREAWVMRVCHHLRRVA